MTAQPEQLAAVLDWSRRGGKFSNKPVDLPAEFSDDSLALRFTAEHGGNLRFTSAWGRWNRWDGHRWTEDDTLRVYDLARATCRDAAGECKNKNVAQRVTSANTVAAVERLARSDRRHAATVDQWDADPWLLNTPGGIVDLHTGNLRPSDPMAYCTKVTAVTPSGDCTLWLSFLHTITGGNAGLKRYLQRVCGYALSGSTREQQMWFLYGTGANGKSVLVTTLFGILGSYGRIAPIETFTATSSESHPTDLASLQGARLVAAVELDDGRRWAESRIKSLTGGDRIAARYMRQDFFEYTPQFKLLVVGNHRPELRTVDEAMRRRLNLVPFEVTIPAAERDSKLTEKLRAEWPGILAWAVQGCVDWQRDGLGAPEAVTTATSAYMASEDRMSHWIADRCICNRESWTAASDLFDDWESWAKSNGEFVGTQRRFSQAMDARKFTAQRNRTGRGFLGIALRKDA